MENVTEAAGIGDAAVKAKTGRTWAEWAEILDEAGAQSMSHKEMVRYLSDQHGVPGWWRQMVVVGYEQIRGLRRKHETPQGYQAGVSRTLPVPLNVLYKAWDDEALRSQWLDAPVVVRKATLNKSMRISWMDGASVDVNFYSKGEGKSQVNLQQSKLNDADHVSAVKAYWGEALERLKDLLDKQSQS